MGDDGRILVAGVLGLVAVAGIMTRRSGSRLVLGELAKVEKGLEGADFWLDAKGKPTRTRGAGLVGVKVTRTDMLVPDYLFYVFEYLVMQGAWREKKVTPEAVRAIAFDVQDDRPSRGSANKEDLRSELEEKIKALRKAQGRGGDRAGEGYAFNIKTWNVEVPSVVTKWVPDNVIAETLADQTNIELQSLVESLQGEYPWVSTDWEQAGRSGGWLVLYDDEGLIGNLQDFFAYAPEDDDWEVFMESNIARADERLSDVAAIRTRVREAVRGYERYMATIDPWEGLIE